MGLAPLPHPLDMSRTFEVIPVGGFLEPAALAGGFARPATLGLGAIVLTSGTARVRIKEDLAVATFTFREWRSHWPASPQVNDLKIAD